ncbi:MAG: NAD(+)/NADH kinase [Oscillospiraceae bacterium]|jgi:NAD+ kinase
MKILLRPNLDKPGSAECTRQTLKKIREFDMIPMLDEKFAQLTMPEDRCILGRFAELLEQCDLILTIGGDGTILHAVQASLHAGKPLLGINTGRLGFLTQLEVGELDHLALLREGNYGLLHRMMLEIYLVRDGKEERHYALNDLVITRGDSDRLVEIDICCQGKPVARHRADGIIFSTPTGSTAYNLSAGGSIVDPTLHLIQMTAICSHSHFNHSIILSPEQVYQVRELPGNNQFGLHVTVDGKRVAQLMPDSHILVKKSQQTAAFIDLRLRDFYSCVDQKLALGGRLS